MGDFNQRVVLDCVRRSSSGISRVEIADLTGLSEQTISAVTRRLLDADLVREAGRRIAGPGKPRILLEMNPDGMFAVGVHLDPSGIEIAVLNLAGSVVKRAAMALDLDAMPEQVLTALSAEIETLLHDIPRDRIIGVGVGAPGPVNWTDGVMLTPPLLPLWRRVHVVEILSGKLGLPVVLEKDVIAAATGEAWLTLDTWRTSFLFVYLGAGLGVGLVAHGQVQRGISHNFGEIGHLVVADDGPALGCCGRVGTLGVRTALGHLTHLAREGGHDTVADLAQAALEEQPHAAAVLDVLAEDLANGLATVTDLFDVDQVVLGGPTWALLCHALLPRLSRAAEVVEPVLAATRPLVLRPSSHARDVVAIGSAAVILEGELSPQPSAPRSGAPHLAL